jgi:integrase
LTDIERQLLVSGFLKWSDHPGARFAELIYRAGMHPCVFSEPERWNLHSDGKNLMWKRPKNWSPMQVPMAEELKLWFEGWWAAYQQRPVTRQTVHQAIRSFGVACGIQGLSPRGLRHTYIFRLASKLPIDEVCRYSGTTVKVAVSYSRMANSKNDDVVSRGLGL